ncbi:MAG: SufD family Fe-S cluster assembly protein [Mariprofundales bacterium]
MIAQEKLSALADLDAKLLSSKNDYWKYTDCRRLAQAKFAIDNNLDFYADVDDICLATTPESFVPIIFINGHDTSNNNTALTASNATSSEQENNDNSQSYFFLKLNDVLAKQGYQAHVKIDDKTDWSNIEKIHIVQHTDKEANLNNLKHSVHVEAGANLILLETITANQQAAGALSNSVLHINLAEGATLHHYRVLSGASANLINHTYVHQQQNSNYEFFMISTGARLARQNINVQLQAEGAQCILNSLQWLAGRQHSDLSVRIEHMAANCTSKQYYKNIAANSSRLACQASAIVKAGADGSDAQQFNGNLLLSEQAEIHGRPDLEIHADDVRCAHGMTCGQLDEQALFYLRARGIDEKQARSLLLQAFAEDLLQKIPDTDMKAYMRQQLDMEIGENK